MKVFIGSTTEQIELVEWASKFLHEELGFEPIPWNSTDAFPSGAPTLMALKAVADDVDGALIFVTADDVTE